MSKLKPQAVRRPPFRPGELSQRWDIPEQTITSQLRKKTIRGFRVGKAWLIPPEEIDRIERGDQTAA